MSLCVTHQISADHTHKTFVTCQEEFEDTKGVISICKSKKDLQYNGQKTKNDLQNITHKTKDRVT